MFASYLNLDRIIVSDATTREGVMEALLACLEGNPQVTDAAALRAAIFDRETLCSTGIGMGIAVPHARLPSVNGMLVSLALVPSGIDFESLDNEPVRAVFMVAGSADSHRQYLMLLARIALLCKNAALRSDLFAAKTPDEAWTVINDFT